MCLYFIGCALIQGKDVVALYQEGEAYLKEGENRSHNAKETNDPNNRVATF